MTEREHRRWRRWFVATIVVLMGGAATFTTIVDPYDVTGAHRYPPMTREPSYRVAKADVLLARDATPDALVLGSSTLQRLPVGAVEGRDVFNASATNATMLDAAAFAALAQRTWPEGEPPAVVVGVDLHRSLARDTILNPALVADPRLRRGLTSREAATVSWRTATSYATWDRARAAIDVVRGAAANAATTPADFDADGVLLRDPYGRAGNRARVLVPAEIDRLEVSLAASHVALDPSPLQRGALRRVLCDATRRNGRSTVVLMPMSPRFTRALARAGLTGAIDRTRRAAEADARGCDADVVDLTDPRSIGVPDERFHDHVHVDEAGMRSLVEELDARGAFG